MLLDEIEKGILDFVKKSKVVVKHVWENRDRIISAAKQTPHACLHASEIMIDLVSDAAAQLHRKIMQCSQCGNRREDVTPMPPTDTPAA